MVQVKAYRGEEEREGYRQRDNQRAPDITEEQEQDDDDEDDALGQIVEHRVRGEVQEIGAVEKGNDLHARRKHALVQLLHLRVDAFQRCVRVVALLQQHNAFHGIGVIEELAVIVDGYGLADLTEADLRSLYDRSDIADRERSSVLSLQRNLGDVPGCPE